MSRTFCPYCLLCLAVVACVIASGAVSPPRADNPAQWGGADDKNNVSTATDLPSEWEVGDFDYETGEWNSEDAKGVLWIAKLGSLSYGTAIISGSEGVLRHQ